ncbi:MAG TPA: DNA gyrase subunit A, partial [Thermoplasmata archaeon]|nr:DNA gyrase subunit A [Thermoplasmata archaeon]
ELKKDCLAEVTLNQLFKHSALETTFGIINLALVDGVPKELSLKEIMQYFIKHRFEIVTKRTEYDLKRAKKRAHILEGLLIALENIDRCIEIIKGSATAEEAAQNLIKAFSLSQEQAKAILEMRLQKMIRLEMKALKDEHAKLMKTIEELTAILSTDQGIYEIIKNELRELKEKYGDERRSEIVEDTVNLEIADLIPQEQMVVTITEKGYIRRIPLEEYRAQRRGGKGLIGLKTVEEDFPMDIFVSWNHDYLLFFSNKGKVYWLKTYQLPLGTRYAKGRAVVNLLPNLEKDEMINAVIPVSSFDHKHYLLFATKKGIIKKTPLSAYGRPRNLGIIALKLREGDELIKTKLSDGTMDVMLATKKGLAVRFHESQVRSMGRVSSGVIGVRLSKGDEVVSMLTVRSKTKSTILTITENGYGKRSKLEDYRKTTRGAKGVRTIKVNERNGHVVGLLDVLDGEEIVVTTKLGMVIRVPVSEVRVQGRDTNGVRIIRLNMGDKVASIAKVKNNKESLGNGDEEQKEGI